MNTPADPRWSDRGRERKATAILHTMQQVCGAGIRSGRWLDVGCGSGDIARALASHVEYIEGIDPEPWARWTEYQADCSNLQFSAGTCDGATIPLPPRAYDVIVCNQVYEHVGDPSRLIANIHEMLADTGVCYFAGPNLLWPIEPHVYWPFVHWLPRDFAQRTMAALGSTRATDLDAYSASCWRLRDWFGANGFEAYNAVPEHLHSLQLEGMAATLVASLSRMPRPVHDTLLPVSPGFVFILRKSGRD